MGSLHRIARRLRRLPSDVRRWHRDRCTACGLRFHWSRDPRHSYGHSDGKVWHGPCISLEQWRTRAAERLVILDVVAETAGLTVADVRGVVDLQSGGDPEGHNRRNLAWRVTRDLQQLRADAEPAR